METLRSFVLLTDVLCWQSKLLEAEEISPVVLQDTQKTLGPDHPVTLDCLAGLGLLRNLQGRYEESILLYEQVFTARKTILGPEHPDTVKCQERWVEVAERLQGLNQLKGLKNLKVPVLKFEDSFNGYESSDKETGWVTAEEWIV